MRKEHLIFCGGLPLEKRRGAEVHELKLGKDKKQGQIRLDTESITKKMMASLPAVLHDLLEVATYVYVADQMISRGGPRHLDYKNEKWDRCLTFRIPVREYGTWSADDVRELLEETVSFVSGTTCTFDFVAQEADRFPEFLNLKADEIPKYAYDEVVLFSGGLDSFTGAVEEFVERRKLPILVGHQSNSRLLSLQRALYEHLVGLRPPGPQPLHAPVLINKDKRLTHETSQRTRSFLYGALGIVVAQMFGLNRVRFYENGIVSCNLPFDGQTFQAKATRSTRPKFLHLLSRLVASLLDKDFCFENPYFGKTRAEVCMKLKELHHEASIQSTRSCAKSTYHKGKERCGTCSQCIDRRFATLASECEESDPGWRYALDIFTDELTNTHDRTMAAGYVGFATQLEGMTRDSFVRRFSSDVYQITKYVGTEGQEVALNSLFHLHQRQVRGINMVMDRQVKAHIPAIRRGVLPDTCLVSMVAAKKHLDIGQMLKERGEGPKKHGKGNLNSAVKRMRDLHPNWDSERIAREIGNTSGDAVRHTAAWRDGQRSE
jgi:hypothetical protein